MNRKRLIKIILVLICTFALASPALADLLTQETPLNPSGEAYELDLDNQGFLWVSDANAGEIWRFNAESGDYSRYPVGGGPSDAHGDGSGAVWWADFTNNHLSRLSAASNQITVWEIPNSEGLYSTAPTSDGNVWVSDYYDPYLYLLDPGINQLCVYNLPDSGISEYLLISGDTLWFGDIINERIMRLNEDTYTWWNLPSGSYPRHLMLDGNAKLWWTDADQGYLGRLDPAVSTIHIFNPPVSGSPIMMSLVEGNIWYTQQNPGRVMYLEPVAANSTST